MLGDGGGISLFYQDCHSAISTGRKEKEETFKHLDGNLGWQGILTSGDEEILPALNS